MVHLPVVLHINRVVNLLVLMAGLIAEGPASWITKFERSQAETRSRAGRRRVGALRVASVEGKDRGSRIVRVTPIERVLVSEVKRVITPNLGKRCDFTPLISRPVPYRRAISAQSAT